MQKGHRKQPRFQQNLIYVLDKFDKGFFHNVGPLEEDEYSRNKHKYKMSIHKN